MDLLKYREMVENTSFCEPTAGLFKDHIQANLVILPFKYAYDFLLFCQRNPKPCPLLEVLDRGDYKLRALIKDADIRSCLPLYRVYEKGLLKAELKDISNLWQDDFVSFLLGCSFSFEGDFMKHELELRHIEEAHNVPMYISDIDCEEAGIFKGKMVVSMRPILKEKLRLAYELSAKYLFMHGAPIHIGDPDKIGIKDINSPDFGEKSSIKEGEVPVFWACGVTPQYIAQLLKIDMISHAPGYMLISDLKNEDLGILRGEKCFLR